MIVASQLVLKTHTNLDVPPQSLDKLVDRFPLPPGAPPIGDTSLTHVMRLAVHSTTSQTPTAMGQSFIMTLYLIIIWCYLLLRISFRIDRIFKIVARL
jgi:hypothetical protein